ncbi:MAG: FtsQ-type POTRA domain-containing protein [Chloroflexi bacterium]|nr:FtsQ-type POTRA domain-containing protein [Chloroflexota bacterium]
MANGKRRSRESVAVVSVDRPRKVYAAPERIPPPRPRPSGRAILRNFSLVVLLSGMLAGLAYGLEGDLFRVRHVSIRGASAAVATSIADTLVPGCDAIAPTMVDCPESNLGPNEITLSGADIQRQLTQLPSVESASVSARLPDQLTISVVERQPEAGWIVGPDIFRVAGDGTVIDRGSPAGLKVVVGQVAGNPVKPGDRVNVEVLHGAEQLQAQLPSQFGFQTRRIQYSPSDGIAVIGDGDLIAMFGEPVDLNLKMVELQRIMQLAGDKKITLGFVDLRYKTPYFRTR